MSRKMIFWLGSLILAIATSGQDIHFSMTNGWTHASLLPITGFMEYDFRFVGGYRTQWGEYVQPYRTFGFMADTKIGSKKEGWAAVGLRILRDNASALMPKTQVGLSAAYHIQTYYGNIFSFAVGIDYYSRRFIPDNVITESQITENGPNPSLPSGEDFMTTPVQYVSVGAGAMGFISLGFDWTLLAGFDMAYINPITETFIENSQFSKRKGVRTRMMIMTEGLFNDTWRLRLVAFLQTLRGANELNTGAMLQYRIQQPYVGSKETAIGGGIWLRAIRNIAPMLTISYDIYTLSASYDIQISKTQQDIGWNGGLEILLRVAVPFSFRYKAGTIHCPRL